MNRRNSYIDSMIGIEKKALPSSLKDAARRRLVDYLAVTCAGACFQREKLAKYFDFAQPEAGDARAIGTGRDLALKEAVYLNGLNAHALDYDDGTNAGIIHLGSPIFSLLLPLAQREHLNMEDVLTAAMIGYEASYTMAVSIQPGHKASGYHATATCGILGATLAGAYMLGFSEEERKNAFAAACTAASGVLKVLDEGSELKPYNVAKTTLLSLTALQMGKAGFRGPEDPLGGRGFLKMMTGKDPSEIELRQPLEGGTYAMQKAYTKPYASCRYTHPAVEAAIGLREKIDVNDITDIEVRTYDLAVSGHDHTEIAGSYSAKMSIPYAVAVGLLFGKAGLAEFTEEMVRDEKVLAMTQKVRVIADEALSADFPKTQGAIVTIRTRNEERSARVDYPKGEPENPMNDAEFKERYDDLMAYATVSVEVSAHVFAQVMTANPTVNELIENL